MNGPSFQARGRRGPPKYLEDNAFLKYASDPLNKLEQDVLSKMDTMQCEELQHILRSLKLDAFGDRSAMLRRLTSFVKEYRSRNHTRFLADSAAANGGRIPQYFDYFLVMDMECTCQDKVYDYAHEIIEFPAVLVNAKTRKVEAEFHSYVRPVLHSQLDPFVINLTGITQEMVDCAPPFLDVLDNFRRWMMEHELGLKYSYAFVTDGPWDIGKFVQCQCLVSGLEGPPHDFRYWINIRRTFFTFFQSRKTPGDRVNSKSHVAKWLNLSDTLKALDMTFEGREHCGLDDTRNIARVVVKLLDLGADPRINERLVRRRYAESITTERADNATKTNVMDENTMRCMGLWNETKETNSRSTTPKPDPTQDELEEIDRRVWRDNYPYVLISVVNSEFFNQEYLHCPSCDEE